MRGRERLEKVMEYMKRYKYAITALAILLDAVVGINPKQVSYPALKGEASCFMAPPCP